LRNVSEAARNLDEDMAGPGPQASAKAAAAPTVQNPDDEPLPSLREIWSSAVTRLRAAPQRLRDAIARASFEQWTTGIGAVLAAAGLMLLPGPVSSAQLAVVIGVTMLLAAAVELARTHHSKSDPAATRSAYASAQPVSGPTLIGDIESLKDAHWTLSESEARYRDLLEAQQDVILRCDGQGRLSFVNAAFCRLLGVDRRAVLGKPFEQLAWLADGPASAAPDRDSRVEQLVSAAGLRWYSWRRHQVPGADSAPAVVETQWAGRDVTEELAAESALAEARDAAEAASKAKSRFLATMSHEIRTPMNGILGMTSLLAETELSPEQRTYARAIGQSARTLLSLIDEILDFSKIEAGRMELHASPFRLEESVQGVVELLSPRAHEKGLEIAWLLAPGCPELLSGDEPRLRQILINLVGNAIKFTEKGGVLVRVAARPIASVAGPSCHSIEIEVEDTGIGLDETARDLIFREFEQADGSPTRRHAGTGLGLAISRRLARAMGGEITVASEPGAGSTFRVSLELPSVSAGANATVEAQAMPTARCHIRLALGDGVEGRAITSMLEVRGHRAEPVSPASTISTLGGPLSGSDALIVDATAGAEACARLLASTRALDAPGHHTRGIVLVTAAQRGSLDDFRAAGFDAYLVRPVRPSSLLVQIGAVPADDAGNVSAATPASGPRSSKGTATKVNVLLAEDNAINALLARQMLEKSGCRVTHVVSGDLAIEACRAALDGGASEPAFDLVLMDMHMPVVDGLAAARAIKAMAAPGVRVPPIIALTANAFAEDRRLCLEAGMDDYLAKPFERADLELIVERWCRSRHEATHHGVLAETGNAEDARVAA
jgi:signal transduction histidine kinase/CheY-like chemotaxis protein